MGRANITTCEELSLSSLLLGVPCLPFGFWGLKTWGLHRVERRDLSAYVHAVRWFSFA